MSIMKNQHNSHKNMQLHINIEHEEAMMSTKDEAYRYMENRCKGYNKTRFVIKLKDLFEF